MKERFAPWFIGLCIMVLLTGIATIALFVPTFFTFIGEQEGSSLPRFALLPYFLVPFLMFMPFLLALMVFIRLFIEKDQSEAVINRRIKILFFLHLFVSLVLLAEFVICIVLAITGGNIMAFSVRGMLTVYTFAVLVVLSVYPFSYVLWSLIAKPLVDLKNDAKPEL